MAKKEQISGPVIKRLPRYLRFISELKTKGVKRISSKELAERMGLTASQIRQDFNCFGGFGQQGYGYDIENLCEEISRILGINNLYEAVLIGAGNLGKAVATHISFNKNGFNLIGIFDKDQAICGQEINGNIVMSSDKLTDFCTERHPKVAILCIPKSGVSPIVEELLSCGVKAFWNFSHYDIAVNFDDSDIIVENVHMNDSLMTLCYHITDIEHPYNQDDE